MPVYMLTNKVNGKRYIGKTIQDLQIRLKWHENAAKRGVSTYLHKAISKYGWDNFSVKVMSDTTDDTLAQKIEVFLIRVYNTCKKGYNLTRGGDGVGGFKQSPEHIEARTAKLRGSSRPDMKAVMKEKAKIYHHQGMSMDLEDWSKYLGVKRSTLYSRLKRGKAGDELFRPTIGRGK